MKSVSVGRIFLVKTTKTCTMQSSAEGLVTFLPHTLPFLCQPAGGLTGTVVIQSSVPAATAAPVQLVQQQRCVLSKCSYNVTVVASKAVRFNFPGKNPSQ